MLCAACTSREPYEPSDWYLHIEYLYRLRSGGYPFEQNDLTVEEWCDLGDFMSAMKMIQGGVRIG